MPSHNPSDPEHPPLAARPVSLLPTDVLARMALDSPLLCDALSLARWSAPAVPVTHHGVPGIDDARTAITRFSLWPHDLPGRPAERTTWLGGLHSAADVAHFVVPWSAALRLGLVEINASHARPAHDLEQQTRDPDRVLSWWFREFEHTIENARGDLARPDRPTPGTTGPELLPGVLRHLYEAPDGSRPDLDSLAREALDSPAPSAPRTTSPLLHVLWQLSDTGAVALDHRPADAPGQDGHGHCTVELTALGRYGVRRLLLEVGIHAPLVDTLAEAGAARFLDALSVLPFEDRLAEAGPWLDRRGPHRALRQIAAVVSGPGLALRRWVGTQVLNTTSSELEPELRSLLRSPHPAVASMAAVVLLSSGMLTQRGLDRMLGEYGPWVVLDMIAAAMTPDNAGLPDFLSSEGTPDVEQIVLDSPDLLRLRAHPDALPVLEALGRHHPDPATSGKARALAERIREDH
ncbi:hypothetical protein ACWFMI_12150 [Nocardiopsis terrae]